MTDTVGQCHGSCKITDKRIFKFVIDGRQSLIFQTILESILIHDMENLFQPLMIPFKVLIIFFLIASRPQVIVCLVAG